MRKIFQKNTQGEISVLGKTEEHPHFYEGTLLAVNSQHYRIVEIREGDLGRPLYVVPISLNDNPSSQISTKLICPYCDTAISEGLLGYAHDTVVDCESCTGVSHVQRLMDCKVCVDEAFEQEIDIIYVILPRIAGAIIPVAVME